MPTNTSGSASSLPDLGAPRRSTSPSAAAGSRWMAMIRHSMTRARAGAGKPWSRAATDLFPRHRQWRFRELSCELIAAFARRAEATHLALFKRTVPDIWARSCSTRTSCYVGGGNTADMLAVWRVHGVDTALRVAWDGRGRDDRVVGRVAVAGSRAARPIRSGWSSTRSRMGSAWCRAATARTTTGNRPAVPHTTGSSRRADSATGTPPTTAQRWCSTATDSPRWSRPDRRRGGIGSSVLPDGTVRRDDAADALPRLSDRPPATSRRHPTFRRAGRRPVAPRPRRVDARSRRSRSSPAARDPARGRPAGRGRTAAPSRPGAGPRAGARPSPDRPRHRSTGLRRPLDARSGAARRPGDRDRARAGPSAPAGAVRPLARDP